MKIKQIKNKIDKISMTEKRGKRDDSNDLLLIEKDGNSDYKEKTKLLVLNNKLINRENQNNGS